MCITNMLYRLLLANSFFNNTFEEQNILIWVKSNLPIFLFAIAITFVYVLLKNLYLSLLQDFYLLFSPEVLGFIFHI